jgi:hypothetical protein
MLARSFAAAALAVLAVAGGACGSDDGATAAFTTPDDGATVAGPVAVAMTADGIRIEAAGEVHDGAGHFHVIADAGCADTGDAIPKDADHTHFGQGQSNGVVYLEPGHHELCLQVADGAHTALDVTDRVAVDVGINDLDEWCDVIADVDQMFETTDNGDVDFPARQLAYENIHRLIAQLSDALTVVDATDRQAVSDTLDFAEALTAAIRDAADPAAADAAAEPVFDRYPNGLPAADWVRDTCHVDVAG